MRYLLAGLALAALAAAPTYRRDERDRRDTRPRQAGGLGVAVVDFNAATWPVAQDLCDYASAQGWLVADAGSWCLKGDATMAAGSTLVLADAGTTTGSLATETVCPSGPDCAAKNVIRFDGTSASRWVYISASVTAPAGAWSACWYGAVDSIDQQTLLAFSRSDKTLNWAQYFGGVAAMRVYDNQVWSDTSGNVIVPNARHLACSVTNAAQTSQQLYVDGATTGAPYDPAMAGNGQWVVGGLYDGTVPSYNGTRTGGAFMLDGTALSGAQVAALARAVLADSYTAPTGQALTYTRSGAMFCPSSSGAGSIVPANRPCVSQGMLWTEPTDTNAVTRWAEIDTWSHAGGGIDPTVTANFAVAPDGSKTAERVQVQACPGAGQQSVVYQSVGTADGGMSVWLKANSGTPSVSICNCNLCAATAVDAGWNRFVPPVSACTYFIVGCENATGVYTGGSDTGAADVLVWGAQGTSTNALSSGIPTTSAAATRGAAAPSLALTDAPALASCEATVTTGTDYASGAALFTLYKDANDYVQLATTDVTEATVSGAWVLGGITHAGASTPKLAASVTSRASTSATGVDILTCLDGVCAVTADAFTQWSGATTLYLGAGAALGNELGPSAGVSRVQCAVNPRKFR